MSLEEPVLFYDVPLLYIVADFKSDSSHVSSYVDEKPFIRVRRLSHQLRPKPIEL